MENRRYNAVGTMDDHIGILGEISVKYTGNAVKTDIRSSLPAALTRFNVRSDKCLNGSFERQAIVRGRIILPFEVYPFFRYKIPHV